MSCQLVATSLCFFNVYCHLITPFHHFTSDITKLIRAEGKPKGRGNHQNHCSISNIIIINNICFYGSTPALPILFLPLYNPNFCFIFRTFLFTVKSINTKTITKKPTKKVLHYQYYIRVYCCLHSRQVLTLIR